MSSCDGAFWVRTLRRYDLLQWACDWTEKYYPYVKKSVPIGVQRIEFHAHRIFSLSYLLRMCSEYYEIEHFSCFDDHGGFHTNVLLTDEIIQSNCGCEKNGIGILELIKK